jgi:thiol-disulfide isomerase/thioredoxin
MKNTIRIILALFVLTGTGTAQEPGVITGTWNRKTADHIFLFKVDNGTLSEMATSKLNDKKEFGFVINADSPGFYVVGLSPKSESFNFTFYIKPGDKLSVAIEGTSYSLTGDNNSPQNREMERWHNLVKDLERHAYYSTVATYVDFFPMLEKTVEKVDSYIPEYPIDADFAERFRSFRKSDLMHIALKFLYMPHSAHPQEEDMADYYNSISLPEVSQDDSLLDYPYGLSSLHLVRLYTARQATNNISGTEKQDFFSVYASLDRDLPQIRHERIKAEAVLSAVSSIRTFDGLQDLETRYGKYLVTDGQKARFKQALIAKASNEKGQDAFDFTFKDINGKETALSGFKGKVVYVDVWATWCGPCRKELPYLKTLEKEYENKNIVFLGISTDDVKDYDKWKKYLKENQMGGVQLFAGAGKDDIMKPYKITGIPRFLLFDRDGKIVSADAPRPSSSEIRPLLDNLLLKK